MNALTTLSPDDAMLLLALAFLTMFCVVIVLLDAHTDARNSRAKEQRDARE